MPHRRLVKIGETPALPTIAQFLTEMANRQHDEIIRLKREAQEAGRVPDPSPMEHHDDLTPDPWQLHPVRVKASAKKSAKKRSPARKVAAKKRGARPVVKKRKTGPKTRAKAKRR